MMKKIFKWASNLKKDTRGQVFALAAGMLPVILGMGAMAVDVGYVYVARNEMQNAADAGALAGAQILATGGVQGNARATAVQYSTQNMAGQAYLAGATTQVTFPTPTQVQVTVNQPNLGLFLAPVIGINTANVNALAAARLNTIGTVPPGGTVPLAIYCQNPGGCTGADLPVGRSFDQKYRHCGNEFGASGSKCSYNPKTPPPGEIFLVGFTTDPPDCGCADAEDNEKFKARILGDLPGEVSIGQTLRALAGTKESSAKSMQQRLDEGRNEFIIPVIERLATPTGGANPHNVKVVDFVKIRITGFYPKKGKNPDLYDFEITRGFRPDGTIATPGQGLGISSVTSVSLSR